MLYALLVVLALEEIIEAFSWARMVTIPTLVFSSMLAAIMTVKTMFDEMTKKIF